VTRKDLLLVFFAALAIAFAVIAHNGTPSLIAERDSLQAWCDSLQDANYRHKATLFAVIEVDSMTRRHDPFMEWFWNDQARYRFKTKDGSYWDLSLLARGDRR